MKITRHPEKFGYTLCYPWTHEHHRAEHEARPRVINPKGGRLQHLPWENRFKLPEHLEGDLFPVVAASD